MNKNWLLFLLIILSSNRLFAQEDSIVVAGEITDLVSSPVIKVIITFTDVKGNRQGFTTKTDDGVFQIKLPKQSRPLEATLRISGNDAKASALQQVMRPPLNIFLFKDDILIKANAEEFDLADVKGGKENNAYNNLRQSTSKIIRQKSLLYKPILQGKLSAQSSEGKELLEEIGQLGRKENQFQKTFIINNPDSYVSLFLLYRMKSSYTSDDYKRTFDNLSPAYKSTHIGNEIRTMINKELVTAKGNIAPQFERLTSTGTPFKLENMYGRVILLDFWGSWCGPCRASMPHLQQLYDRYKKQGFEIIGIAHEQGKTLHDSKKSWLNAITELNLPWTNVLNNENKQDMDIVKEYQINGFPTKILIDEKGKIIMRVIASATDDIDKALKAIYGY
ncbi:MULTISPECIES: TlpA family protein disulfide reductase [Sphingobacterium]|uniref:TlpA family protein disulfide reductase n=2 Tax=Sphingobacterium TaxID=28453 RepID=A0ABX7CM05_SPHMU|nr:MULTISPECIES: TlpA disulfide reductase family protein [Sphingobacterium]QQT31011.1 TlpA family protein disulfide reductase [Sphingobacterium multivorum]QQT53056.1 TlpA family protein disulfide reductase [Sphingobacterium multivorum]QRY58182.1 TlpA family protein disulfide reductase [Sphingobacterium siyangense]RKF40900.1 hypothetical protein BCY89_20885 [Sphingobacterium siyangense]